MCVCGGGESTLLYSGGLCIGSVYQLLRKDTLIIEDKAVQHKYIACIQWRPVY